MIRQLSTALTLIAGALAASSDSAFPTLTSTILSCSTCQGSSSVNVVPSSFAYSNATTVGKLPIEDSTSLSASITSIESSSARSTIYEYETVTTDDIFEVVQTVCDSFSHCYATTNLESFTTYTTTIDGVLTVVTTGVPYTTTSDHAESISTTTASDIITTLDETVTVTKTHCDEVCHVTTELEVLGTYTSTINGIETVYTTYCPLSSEKAVVTTSSTPSTTKEPETTATTTDISTAIVTITSCKDHKCTEVPVTTGVTTVIDETTSYTTYCPLSSSATTETDASTAVITITSCKDDKCTKVPVTTGVTTVIDETTSYTTYCPLSETTSETTAETSEITTVKTTAPVTTPTTSALSTVNVITDNIITETPTAKPSTLSSISTAATASVSIQTYEAAGIMVKSGLITLTISFILSLI